MPIDAEKKAVMVPAEEDWRSFFENAEDVFVWGTSAGFLEIRDMGVFNGLNRDLSSKGWKIRSQRSFIDDIQQHGASLPDFNSLPSQLPSTFTVQTLVGIAEGIIQANQKKGKGERVRLFKESCERLKTLDDGSFLDREIGVSVISGKLKPSQGGAGER